MCLPIKPLGVLVLLLASINLFVHNLTLVLIFRKGQLNLLSCKVLFLFHNCYYCYCWILNFNTHSPPHFENNNMKVSKRNTFIIIIFIIYIFILVDQWTQLCFLRQEIICHNVFGLVIHSSRWMVALIVWREF